MSSYDLRRLLDMATRDATIDDDAIDDAVVSAPATIDGRYNEVMSAPLAAPVDDLLGLRVETPPRAARTGGGSLLELSDKIRSATRARGASTDLLDLLGRVTDRLDLIPPFLWLKLRNLEGCGLGWK